MCKIKVGNAVRVITSVGAFVGICIRLKKSTMLLRSSVNGCVIDYNLFIKNPKIKKIEIVKGWSRKSIRNKYYMLKK